MLDVKTRFLNVLAAWLALSSALEMFRGIVVNNIDTYKARGSLTRRNHVDLNHELMQSSVVLNPHTGEKPRRQSRRRAFRKGKRPSPPPDQPSQNPGGWGEGRQLSLFPNFQGWLLWTGSAENEGVEGV